MSVATEPLYVCSPIVPRTSFVGNDDDLEIVLRLIRDEIRNGSTDEQVEAALFYGFKPQPSSWWTNVCAEVRASIAADTAALASAADDTRFREACSLVSKGATNEQVLTLVQGVNASDLRRIRNYQAEHGRYKQQIAEASLSFGEKSGAWDGKGGDSARLVWCAVPVPTAPQARRRSA